MRATQRNGQLELAASGAWTAPHAAQLELMIEGLIVQDVPRTQAAIDMVGVEAFDTYGAWLLRRLERIWQERGQRMRIVGLVDRYQGLLSEVEEIRDAPAAAR
ncbi:MAG TPA: STAS domain-containing protein, partial [Hyphomicrobiaceae bacterium]|nr:STAS domain-containing protein [Hyphomicrobiaceae bacterium]